MGIIPTLQVRTPEAEDLPSWVRQQRGSRATGSLRRWSETLSCQFRVTARHLLTKARKWPELEQMCSGQEDGPGERLSGTNYPRAWPIIKEHHPLFTPAVAQTVWTPDTRGFHPPHCSAQKTEV